MVVLGAGIAECLTALSWPERGYSADRAARRARGLGHRGAVADRPSSATGCDISKIEAQLGLRRRPKLFDWSVRRVDMIAERIRCYSIDCDGPRSRPYRHQAASGRRTQTMAGRSAAPLGYTGTELWDRPLQQELATGTTRRCCSIAQRPSRIR